MYKGSLVIAGECMCTRPFSMHDEPEFLEMIKLLRDADTAYCHLEMNIHEKGTGYPGKAYMPSALQADPVIAHELKWAGFDLVSCAFNHATDWGIPGLLGTIDSLDKAGMVHAGTGNNLEEAREPAYFESQAGRVAIISMSSGHHSCSSASPVHAPVVGRPGVNPLRVVQKFVVKPETLEHLKNAWNELGLSMKRPFMVPGFEEGDTFLVSGDVGGGNAATLIFRVGEQPEIITIPDKCDVEGNLRAIKDARRQADLVIVAHHTAVNDGKRGSKPCKFVPSFARGCIDAGADVYIGHGWHSQLGIELYKEKPVIYGTGNFFAESQYLPRFPSDTYEGHGFDPNDMAKMTPADVHDIREIHMPHWKEEPGGIIANFDIEGGRFKEIKLHPFMMGYEFGTGVKAGNESMGYEFNIGGKTGKVRETGTRMDGRPMLTHGANAERIIEHTKKLCRQYNTKVEYKNGIGIIKIQ